MNNDKVIRLTNGYMRLPQVLNLIPIGKSTWWAGVKAGKYPKPLKIGPKITVWKVSDIMDFLNTLETQPLKTA